jgi:hypothetical protein
MKRWLTTLTLASDVAVVGFAVTLLALPLVTAPAALRAGSVAVHAIAVDGRKLSVAELWRAFCRSLLPGFGWSLTFAFLALDFAVVRAELVPGGRVLLGLLAVAAWALLGITGVALATLGRFPSMRWLPAVRTALGQPGAVAAAGAVLAVAATIAVLIPFTTPLLAGYGLFALHALAARRSRASEAAPVATASVSEGASVRG